MNDGHSKSALTAASSSRSSSRSVYRSARSTGIWLRRSVWVWPLIAALALGTGGWFLRGAIEQKLRDEMAGHLQTILNADVAALRFWMQSQEQATVSTALNLTVETQAEKLKVLAAQPQTSQLDLLQSPELAALREELQPVCETGGYNGWLLVNAEHRILASDRNELIGIDNPKEDQAYAERALQGKTTVSPPRKSVVLLPNTKGELQAGIPTMFAWGPVRDSRGEVIAALGLRIPPDKVFTPILGVARSGSTGDTYAIAEDGRMVSGSRFDADLRQVGLLSEDQDSILNVSIRDPGVNMSLGRRPTVPRAEQPLTRAAESVLAGKSEVDVRGYRNYRGVNVIGAWTWLPEYGLGVISEQESTEAYGVLGILRAVFFSLFGLLAIAAATIFVGMSVMRSQQRDAQRAALELRRLGQYSLEEKLGKGGMGVVYRGSHAMLHRPTAIKFLDVDKTNEQTIARFEREVQLTARLTHPNTIAIYDYGRTPEGIFYYAMECLEGLNLNELVQKCGPLPEARVTFILQQVCGSLTEAHGIGLIHRDIKPANIFLTARGGLYDFVKLLDFGLVRALDEAQSAKLTNDGAMAGTPLYLSPEAIEHPDVIDARSDLYALGAVGYFLLTGTPVFDGPSVIEIIRKHVSIHPDLPSQRLGKPVSLELETLLVKCLQKSPDDRPQSAAELGDALAACSQSHPWTKHDAALWWAAQFPETHRVEKSPSVETASVGETIVGVIEA